MVLSFQAQELAREDVHEAQLPAVRIDVEVRHRAYESIPRVKHALPAHFVLWWRGMFVPLQPDQGHGSSFPTGACGPSISIITISAQRFSKGPIHPSAWKECTHIFAFLKFSEVVKILIKMTAPGVNCAPDGW